jgi:hypothetical protein
MTPESTYELQRIDCNCNNCGFMQRDFQKFQQSLNDHHAWQLDYFNGIRDKMIHSAIEWYRKGDIEKHDAIMKEVSKRKFHFFRNECHLNYGNCLKFAKPVSFIPNTCQLETQHCFIHRKDYSETLK